MTHTPKRPQDMSVEKLLAGGFTTSLREHDALCDLRGQYETWLIQRAAPDLLEAAELFAKAFDSHSLVVARYAANAAIRKARGAS